jgi:hypothetical protein
MADPAPPKPALSHRWLLALPFVWQLGLTPLINDVGLRPLGLPFPMVWQMLGIVFTTAIIAIVFAIDKRLDPDMRDADGISLPKNDPL